MYESLCGRAIELGALEAKLIDTGRIVFDPRSFLKCRFGCNRWGRYWTCPPNLSLGPEEFMKAFDRYRKAIIIKAPDPRTGQEIGLAVEKEAMMACGSMFAFSMFLCVLCEKCAFPAPCLHPHEARPSMDAYGIDIGKTIEPLGFTVQFDGEGKLLPAWYGLVLLD